MKWFTREWQSGEMADEQSGRVAPAYAAYAHSIESRLPDHVLAFAAPTERHLAVDDAKVDRTVLDVDRRQISFRLLTGDLPTGYGMLDLVFVDADLVDPSVDRLRALFEDERTAFLVHEVELVDEDGRLEVRFLLWPDGEIAIRCSDVQAQWAPISDTTRTDARRELVGFG